MAKGRWVRAGIALFVAGCFPHLDMKDEAKIACTDSSDCPQGWVCPETTRQCADPGDDDGDPPGLEGTAKLVPAWGRQGDLFTLTFRVNEELFARPEVTLDGGFRFEWVEDFV